MEKTRREEQKVGGTAVRAENNIHINVLSNVYLISIFTEILAVFIFNRSSVKYKMQWETQIKTFSFCSRESSAVKDMHVCGQFMLALPFNITMSKINLSVRIYVKVRKL